MGQTDHKSGVHDLGWHVFAIMLIFPAELVRPSAIHAIPRNYYLHFVQGATRGRSFLLGLEMNN